MAYNVTANALTQVSYTRMRDAYSGPTATGELPSERATAEQRPDTVAPLVVYLASPAAADVTGRVFGSYGYRYVRWSEPVHERDLRHPLPALDDGYRTPTPHRPTPFVTDPDG